MTITLDDCTMKKKSVISFASNINLKRGNWFAF